MLVADLGEDAGVGGEAGLASALLGQAEVGPVRELVRSEMVGAFPLAPPLAVDVGVGDDWNDAKS